MMIYILFLCISPDFGALYTFYLKDEQNFTNIDFANISAVASILYVIALVFYYWKLKKVSPSKLFIGLNIISWIFNCSFFLVVLNLVESWGMNVKYFCIVTMGLGGMFTELYMMPILAIWCGICPKNLEALSITIITGFINFSVISSEYLGGFLIWLIKFDKTNYSKLWIPLSIENAYLLVILFFLIFVKFPDPRSSFAIILTLR